MSRRNIIKGDFSDRKMDLSDPIASTKAYVKLLGIIEGGMVHYSLEGKIYSMLPKGPKPFIGFQTILKGVWRPLQDNAYSYRLFEVGFFADLETGIPIKKFINPVTNVENDLITIKGGPYDSIIKPNIYSWIISGDDVWIEESKSLNGYFGSSQKLNNNDSEASVEEIAFLNRIYRGQLSELNDAVAKASCQMHNNYISPWYPFFKMENVEGKMYWQAVGTKIDSFSEVPQKMKNFLLAEHQEFFDSEQPWSIATSTLAEYRRIQNR